MADNLTEGILQKLNHKNILILGGTAMSTKTLLAQYKDLKEKGSDDDLTNFVRAISAFRELDVQQITIADLAQTQQEMSDLQFIHSETLSSQTELNEFDLKHRLRYTKNPLEKINLNKELNSRVMSMNCKRKKRVNRKHRRGGVGNK